LVPVFTAINIPDQVAQILALKKGKLNAARWIDSRDYHITLSFLGDISAVEAEKAADQLARIQHKPFEICISGLDIFGSKKPRTLFARVRCDEALANLQAKNERAMKLAGLKIQARKYAPHVTLARLGQVRPQDVGQFQHLGQFMPAFAHMATGIDHAIGTLASCQLRVFFDHIKRHLTGAPKNRKYRPAFQHINGIITPLTTGHAKTIDAQDKIEFLAVKPDNIGIVVLIFLCRGRFDRIKTD
jgi:2'-5' RNA ligase